MKTGNDKMRKILAAILVLVLVFANNSSLAVALTVMDGEEEIIAPDGERWIQETVSSNDEETEWNGGQEYEKVINLFDGSKAESEEGLSVSLDGEDLHNEMVQNPENEDEWFKEEEKTYIFVNDVDVSAQGDPSDDVLIMKDNTCELDLGEEIGGDWYGGDFDPTPNEEFPGYKETEGPDGENVTDAMDIVDNGGQYWGMRVVYSELGRYEDINPYDQRPYFVEMFANGPGHIDFDFEAHPDYEAASLGNAVKVRYSSNVITAIVVSEDPFCPFSELAFWDEAGEHVYSVDDLAGRTENSCPFISYNDANGELTFTFDGPGGELWGVDIRFFDPNGPSGFGAEVFTDGAGHLEPEEENNPSMRIDPNCGNRYEFSSENKPFRIKVCPDEGWAFSELEYPVDEYPEHNVRLSTQDLMNGSCSFISNYNEAGQMLEIAPEDENPFIGGITIRFTCTGYGAEVFTDGAGHLEPAGENNPRMRIDPNYDNRYEFSSENNAIRIKLCSDEGWEFYEVEYPVDEDPLHNARLSKQDIMDGQDSLITNYDEAGQILEISLGDDNHFMSGITVRFQEKAYRSRISYIVGEHGNISFNLGRTPREDGGWYRISCDEETVEVTISPDEGYQVDSLRANDTDRTSEISNNRFMWALAEGENTLSVNFKEKVNYADKAASFKKLIEDKKYAFGDWDKDGDIDSDDLKLGMAQVLYYPAFSSDAGNSFKRVSQYEEVNGVAWFTDKLSFEASPADNLKVLDGDDVERTLTAYKYEFTYTDEAEATRSVSASGVAYLFKFDDDSIYSTKSTQNVVMYATKGTTTKYFIRNTDRESDDAIDPSTGSKSGDGAFCAVADFDIGSQYNDYGRNVGIFGNGASLDNFVMTDKDETALVTIQGRNEELARDTGHDVIFGKFSFYKNDFRGMKIQGSTSGLGSTPSWSFAVDPIYGSDSSSSTTKEADIFFGNKDVAFAPVTVNGKVEGIKAIEKADASIPDEAVKVYKDSGTGKWKAEFNSDFYDQVKFKVTYETAEGDKTEYIVIHRVGLDIQEQRGGSAGSSTVLMHGTENGPSYTFTKDCETIIKATYYYPEQGGTSNYVDLYVTYTWKDGTVTKELIGNKSSLNLAWDHNDTGNCQSSDFVLYEGSSTDAPVKVEVNAVSQGFNSETSFNGMKLGSGRGVLWTR